MMMKPKMLLAVAVAAAAFAQGPMRPQPTFSNVKQYLNLTDAQIQSLQQVRQQEGAAISPLLSQMRTKQSSLRSLMDSGGDAAAIAALIQDIQNLRKQVEQTRSTYMTQAKAVLTADQATKLKTLQDAANLQPSIHEAAMLDLLTPPEGGMGPGGPGGMGFGGGPRGAPMMRRDR